MDFRWTSVVLAAALCAGCSSTKLPDAPAATASAAPTSGAAPAPGTPTRSGEASAGTASAQSAAGRKAPALERSVHFEFDSARIRDADKPVIEAHARYLAADRAARAKIEGHCDERGGREYNLALGQKRAEAVRRTLVLLGAADASLEAVSFGKEKPVDPGHDETAWARNRRADVNHAGR